MPADPPDHPPDAAVRSPRDAAIPSPPGVPRPDPGVRRIAAIDAARGLALAAMAAYHAVWDLGFLRLIPEQAAATEPGRAAAHVIAGTFLGLVGLSLVLATRGGLRPRPYLARLARIGGAALAVTLATRFLFPDSYIFFGVLHCIAVSSVLALPFLLAPTALAVPAALLVAVLALAAPWLPHAEALDAPALSFLGLGRNPPQTNDWVPLCPWFGIVLAGLVLGRLGLPALQASALGRWQARGPLSRILVGAGRHSLAVYLVHQPVLLGLSYGLLALTGPHPRAGVAEFRRQFQDNCTRTGGSGEACRVAGRCVSGVLRREGLWDTGTPYTDAQRMRARGLAQRCYQAAEGTMPPP